MIQKTLTSGVPASRAQPGQNYTILTLACARSTDRPHMALALAPDYREGALLSFLSQFVRNGQQATGSAVELIFFSAVDAIAELLEMAAALLPYCGLEQLDAQEHVRSPIVAYESAKVVQMERNTTWKVKLPF